jgi:hypothetical protein
VFFLDIDILDILSHRVSGDMAPPLREDAGRMNVLMAFRFEFDPANKILLLRAEGRMTDELLGKLYPEVERHWAATDARALIVDFSAATEPAASSGFIHRSALSLLLWTRLSVMVWHECFRS